ncbi:aspartate/glutamate racemase family protein [Paenibacillus campi]|uniref:aspartate/glutamate racemase family protein n=1 Tax=Paenibacillus campi TaxID=3106031 RepID=UPI002AFEA981|nr:aspartate/glutamate racemase family protein [Paenibacillus sp. SGZ-1009]
MKTIGLIGGMSWESSMLYYQIVNETVKRRLGGHHSAQCLMYSVDFQQIKDLQHRGDWAAATEMMVEAAQKLQAGGADMIVICTNTMHKMAAEVMQAVSIPLLHIADATASRIVADRVHKVALLGTAFTMEQDFYKGRLVDTFGLDVIVPEAEERAIVHDVIYEELCLGIINESSKQKYIDIIDRLVDRGAEAVILGCTEITMLIGQTDCRIPVYDTTRLHAEAAVAFALEQTD